jgi:hypothetical protein
MSRKFGLGFITASSCGDIGTQAHSISQTQNRRDKLGEIVDDWGDGLTVRIKPAIL